MSFWYTKFGSLNLSLYEPSHDLQTGAAATQLIPLPGGGVFDALGNEDAPLQYRMLSVRHLLWNTTDTEAALQSLFNALRAKIGTREQLFRRLADGSTLQWSHARLKNVVATREVLDLSSLPVTLQFELISQWWYAATAKDVTITDIPGDTGDLATTLAESSGYPVSFTLTNDGNVDNDSVLWEITAGSASITAVTITNTTTGHAMSWSGTLAIGDVLRIHTGELSVLNDGANDYASFTPPSNKEAWFKLQPGENTVTISITTAGTGETVRYEFYDAFA